MRFLDVGEKKRKKEKKKTVDQRVIRISSLVSDDGVGPDQELLAQVLTANAMLTSVMMSY